VVEELHVVYWPDRPKLPEEIALEDNEYRPFLHYFGPKGAEEPVAGILLLHGGGFGAGHPDEYHTRFPLAPWLASRGYAFGSGEVSVSTRVGTDV
jgi:hypothetical protein